MTPTRLGLVLAVALAGCTTKNQSSYLEILRVVPATYAAGTTTTPSTCTAGVGPEVDFLNIDLKSHYGQVGLVVSNALLSNGNSAINRLNTNDFIATDVLLSYEIIGEGGAPASIKGPAQGLVPASTTAGVISTFLFPKGGGFGASIPSGKTVRVTFHVEGHLVDGSSVRTNEYAFIFLTCLSAGTADCSSNLCL